MGELLKKCGEINIKEKRFDIELNAPIHEVRGGIVHIQNENMRLEMSQADFCSMVGAFRIAEQELRAYKKFND